jgi:hypothetical protein
MCILVLLVVPKETFINVGRRRIYLLLHIYIVIRFFRDIFIDIIKNINHFFGNKNNNIILFLRDRTVCTVHTSHT